VMPEEVRRNLMITPGKANELAVAFLRRSLKSL